MTIGIVTTNPDLQRVLMTEARNNGRQAASYENLSDAVANAPLLKLVFAERPIGGQLPLFLAALSQAASLTSPLPVVVLVSPGAVSIMKRARTEGASDVLFFPPDPAEIKAEIDEVFGLAELRDTLNQKTLEELRMNHLIGKAVSFLKCLEEMKIAARSEAHVLILGETGTGKEMFARAIHRLSSRAGNKLVPFNCASVPSSLLESELFGHVRGAFTGADRTRLGRLEEVGGGTLFLDEIGDIEPSLQTKLLRVVEYRKFQRVGSNEEINFPGRLICATSVDLEKAVAEGRFRRDLLSRINQFRIALTPLRDRDGDIQFLSKHFLRKHAKGLPVEISSPALKLLESYDFPMNIRELENAIIESLARSAPGRIILPRHLPQSITTEASRKGSGSKYTINIPEDMQYEEARNYARRAVDYLYLSEFLQKNDGNRSRAADEAHIDRKTFNERLGQALQNREDDRDG